MISIPENLKLPARPFARNSELQPARLNGESILVEVIEWMKKNADCQLPVYNSGNSFLGMISLNDILIFLEHDTQSELYYHKLNYTLESLVALKKGTLKKLFKTKNNFEA